MRLIDADLIRYIPRQSLKGNGLYEDVMVAYKHQINDIPTIEERKKGKWISHYDENAKEGWYECSYCHSERAFNTKYCPDCGADITGEEND